MSLFPNENSPNQMDAKAQNRTSYPILDRGAHRTGYRKFQIQNPFEITVDVFLYPIIAVSTKLYENYDGNEFGDLAKYQDSYDSERELYKMLQMEGFNIHGLPMLYHVTTFSTDYDPLFGEDNNTRVERIFSFMGYMPDLPSNHKNWNFFQIEGIDQFTIHVNKEHFKVASANEVSNEWNPTPDNNEGYYPTDFSRTFTPSDSSTGTTPSQNNFDNESFSDDFDIGSPISRDYIPKVGDIIKIGYNEVFFEITTVKEEKEMFLQDKHSWELIVKITEIDKRTVEGEPPLNHDSGLSELFNKATDEFDQSQNVEDAKDSTQTPPNTFPETSGKAKPNPLYEPKPTEPKPRDPFGGF